MRSKLKWYNTAIRVVLTVRGRGGRGGGEDVDAVSLLPDGGRVEARGRQLAPVRGRGARALVQRVEPLAGVLQREL